MKKKKIRELKQTFILGMVLFVFFACYIDVVRILRERALVLQKAVVTMKQTEKQPSKVKREELKIGFVTDAHCYSNNSKKNNYTWKLNWRCTEPLQTFIGKMNTEFHPDFVVDGGDLIDGKDKHGVGTFDDVQKVYEKLNAPLYHVLGNHEMKSFVVEEWTKQVGYDKAYYSFDTKGYRIIVLDGNYRPTSEGEMQHTRKGLLYYPGAIGEEEMTWLESTLSSALQSGLTSIVFIHQPPIGVDARSIERLFVDGEQLEELFFQYHVLAVFSGHIERLCDMPIVGTDYYVLQGFWKGNNHLKEEYQYRNGGAFSEITIAPNGDIKTEMFYRKSRYANYTSLLVDPISGNCLDGQKLVSREQAEMDLEHGDEEDEPVLD